MTDTEAPTYSDPADPYGPLLAEYSQAEHSGDWADLEPCSTVIGPNFADISLVVEERGAVLAAGSLFSVGNSDTFTIADLRVRPGYAAACARIVEALIDAAYAYGATQVLVPTMGSQGAAVAAQSSLRHCRMTMWQAGAAEGSRHAD